jgi:hypothetical protein
MGRSQSRRKSRFFFVIRSPDWEDDDLDGTLLDSPAVAIAYAHRIIRELKEGGGYDTPRLVMIVQNHKRETVVTIPF